MPLENANPLIYRRSGERPVTAREEDDELPDSIDDREIFDILPGRRGCGGAGGKGGLRPAFLNAAHLIRSINDPEHPLTLEELNVVEQVRVKVRLSYFCCCFFFPPCLFITFCFVLFPKPCKEAYYVNLPRLNTVL